MKSASRRSKRLLLCLLPLLVISSQSGCSIGRYHTQVAGSLSEYWGWRAERAQFAEAKREHARSEKAMAKAQAHSEGTVQEVVSTDYTITLEKGMEIESMSLDFDEIEKMKAQQAKLDTEYEKAKTAYDKLQANAYRQKLADDKANAEAGQTGACGCEPKPSCAEPPEKALAMGPPPKRMALGTENLPLVIKARYSIAPRQTAFANTGIQRRYQPGKGVCEPGCDDEKSCCPCGDWGCTQNGTCTPSTEYVESTRDRAPYRATNNEPETLPPSEVRRQPKPKRTETRELEDFNVEPVNPFKIGSSLFEGEIEPLLLSDGD